MPIHLIFLFLFQGGLAFAFSYFIARILIGGREDSSRDELLKGLDKIRNVVLVFTLLLPPVMFFAYFKSLPAGNSVALAIWPAAWIFTILFAIVAALFLATAKARHRTP